MFTAWGILCLRQMSVFDLYSSRTVSGVDGDELLSGF